jgi:hypothetical protein
MADSNYEASRRGLDPYAVAMRKSTNQILFAIFPDFSREERGS